MTSVDVVLWSTEAVPVMQRFKSISSLYSSFAYASRCYEVCIYYVLRSIYMPVCSGYFYGTTWKCVECSTSIWAHESASCYLRPGRTGRRQSSVLKTGKKTTQGGRRLLASGDLGGHGWEGHCWGNQVLGLIHSAQTVFPGCVEASTAAN